MAEYSELKAQFDEWWANGENRFAESTKADKDGWEKFWIENRIKISNLTGARKEELEKWERITSAPDFDEAAFFGLDEDDEDGIADAPVESATLCRAI